MITALELAWVAEWDLMSGRKGVLLSSPVGQLSFKDCI